jgi:hypothetical protein
VCAVKLEHEGGEAAGENTTSVEMDDAMIESLSLETTDHEQPSSSRVTMKSFQSRGMKNGDAHGRKKRKLKKKYI